MGDDPKKPPKVDSVGAATGGLDVGPVTGGLDVGPPTVVGGGVTGEVVGFWAIDVPLKTAIQHAAIAVDADPRDEKRAAMTGDDGSGKGTSDHAQRADAH